MKKIKWSDICESPREIDKLIAIHVFDRDVFTYDDKLCSGYCFESLKLPSGKIMVDWIPHYSEYIADAWKVVEEFKYKIIQRPEFIEVHLTESWESKEYYSACNKDIKLAICKCALIAKEIVEE